MHVLMAAPRRPTLTSRRRARSGATPRTLAALAALAALAVPIPLGQPAHATPAHAVPGSGEPISVPASPTASSRGLAAEASAVPADAVADQVVIELSQISPAVMTGETDVTIAGWVQNSTDTEVQVDTITVETAYRGLDTRSLLDLWAQDALDITVDTTIAEIDLGVIVAPQERWPFTLRIEADEVNPPFDYATLPLRITAGGVGDTAVSTSDTAGGPIVAQVNSYLLWDDGSSAHVPLRIGTVLPLTLPADDSLWSADPEAHAQAWDALAGPRSSTARTLRTLTGYPVTFIADPSITRPLLPPDTLYALADADDDDDDEPDGDDQSPQPTDVPTQLPAQPEPTSSPEPAESSGAPTPAPTDQPSDQSGGDSSTDGGSSDDQSTGETGQTATATPGIQATATPPTEQDGTTDTAEITLPATSQPTDDETGEAVAFPIPEELLDEEVQGPTADGSAYLETEDVPTLLEELAAGQLWWLPTGDPDLSAFAALGWEPQQVGELLGNRDPQSVNPTVPLPGTATRTDIAWPLADTDHPVDLDWVNQTWQLISGQSSSAAAGPAAVIQPASTLGDGTWATVSAVQRIPDGPLVLGYDEGLAGLLTASPQVSTGGSAGRAQRLIAETLAIYQEQPMTARTLLLSAERGAEVDPVAVAIALDGMRQASWTRPVSGTALLTTPTAAVVQDAGLGPAVLADSIPPTSDQTNSDQTTSAPDGHAVVSEALIEDVGAVAELLEGAAAMVPDGPRRRDLWLETLDQSWSARWRLEPEALQRLVEQPRPVAAEVLDGIEVNPTTINFLANEGQIQVTIINTLPVTIEGIHVEMTPSHHRLRVIDQADPLTIGAESRATVRVRAQAIAPGDVDVDIVVTAPNGSPMGEAAAVEVRVQPMGDWLYWALGGVAGVILVLGLWRTLRPKNTAPSPAPSGLETSGPSQESPAQVLPVVTSATDSGDNPDASTTAPRAQHTEPGAPDDPHEETSR